MSHPPAASTAVERRAVHGQKLQADAELAGQVVRHLHVKSDEVAALVEESEWQRVVQIPDSQHAALANALDHRA